MVFHIVMNAKLTLVTFVSASLMRAIATVPLRTQAPAQTSATAIRSRLHTVSSPVEIDVVVAAAAVAAVGGRRSQSHAAAVGTQHWSPA